MIHNERLKITANWINSISVGFIVTGLVAPFVGLIYGFSAITTPASSSRVLISASICLLSGIVLHFLARLVLKELKP